MDLYRIKIAGKDAFELGHNALKMEQFEALVKAGACINAKAGRCSVDGKDILKDGAVVFTTATELERSEKFTAMVIAGQCKL